jgi:DnaK suppressor protein
MLQGMRTRLNQAVARTNSLRQTLADGRNELQTGLRARIRDGRIGHMNEAQDAVDESDAANQRELTFALLQMRAEALARVDQALDRLDAGYFGSCCDCDGRITEARLRALPFAVRCTACEQRREHSRAPYQGTGPQFGSLTSPTPHLLGSSEYRQQPLEGVRGVGEDNRNHAWSEVDIQTVMEKTRRS